jgi:hypothetical protein
MKPVISLTRIMITIPSSNATVLMIQTPLATLPNCNYVSSSIVVSTQMLPLSRISLIYHITTCIIFICNLHLQESFYFGCCCSNSRRALYFDFPSISVCLLNSCALFVPITYPSCC